MVIVFKNFNVYIRNKFRRILQFENLEYLFMSNYWVEKELQDWHTDIFLEI